MALTPIHNNGGPKGSNGVYGKGIMHGMTPKPAGKPKGGKAIAANPNVKGGSGSY